MRRTNAEKYSGGDDDDDPYNTDDYDTDGDDDDNTTRLSSRNEDFRDEPRRNSRPYSSNQDDEDDVDDDVDDEEEGLKGSRQSVTDEERDRHRKAQSRARMAGCILCLCCLVLVGTAVVVGYFLFGNNDDDSSSPRSTPAGGPEPTAAPDPVAGPTSPPMAATEPTASEPTEPEPNVPPTFAPVNVRPSSVPPPTKFPTRSPVPTIYTTSNPTPKPTEYPTAAPSKSMQPTAEFPDLIELMPYADTQINRDGFLKADRFGEEDSFLVQNGLRLENERPDTFGLMVFDTTTVPDFHRLPDRDLEARLQLTHLASDLDRGAANLTLFRLPPLTVNIETLNGESIRPSVFYGNTTFSVLPSDVTLNIDVTDLFFFNEPLNGQFFIMIDNLGPEQLAGDRFRTRESEFPPKLSLYFAKPPTVSPAPSSSFVPTMAPSSSAIPTANASAVPTAIPTANASAVPTAMPTDNSTLDEQNRTGTDQGTNGTAGRYLYF